RAHFDAYTHEPPRITDVAAKVRRKRVFVTFRLSKISTVTVSSTRRGRAAGVSKAIVGHGKRRFSFKRPKRKGLYSVSVVAVDLAGNRETVSAKLRVR
ncbi:MAG: hypothetical protein JJE27_06690, partial [Thermoleophilia bacterium]|nr:hypothetical protein [Thermoleophilia bacterium]